MMTSYNFDEIIDRRASDSGKWNRFDADVLPLWVADMDFKSPQPVLEAIINRVEHGVLGYPVASSGLSQAVVEWLEKRHNWSISSEQVVIIPAIISGFHLVTQAFADQRGVAVQTPAYPPFLHVAREAGIPQILNPLKVTDKQYEIDFESFERTVEKADVFILCNPQNPTGRVFTQYELERMAEICLRHNVFICSDEIHSDLIFSGQHHIPIASLSPEIAAKTITLIAPSKTFNIAGLKTAAAIVPSKEVYKQLMSARVHLMGHANVLGQVAAEAAYRQGLPWLEALLVYLEANRDYLLKFIEDNLPGIHCFSPQGTYLAWLDCNALNLPESPYQFFLKEARVGLNDGGEFGENGNGFVRINFGCPRATLEDALNRMQSALIKHNYLRTK